MKVALKDLGDIITGNTPSKRNIEFWNSKDIKFIKPDIISENKIELINNSNEYISENARKKARIVGKNTIFVTCIGIIGKIGIAGESEYAFNQQINAIVPNKNVIPKYIAYNLLFNKPKLEAVANAPVVPIINKSQFGEFLIDVDFDINKQNYIVNILDKLTNIIDKKEEELKILDNLVKSRFTELFGNLNTNEMGWDEIPLIDACNQLKRYPTFCNMEYLPNGIKVIRIGNILADGSMDENDKNYVFVYDEANVDFPDTVIELQDIVMAVRGDGSAAKRIGIIQEEKLVGANISPNLIKIRANKEIMEPMWLFYYLTSEVGQKRLDAYVNKTAKKNIAAKDIAKVITPVPSISIQQQFTAFVSEVDKSKLAVEKSLKELEILKKSLMQKYFGN